ncbi:MAG: DUF2178 domain-containing protein [Methanospirillum sp.]
MKRNTFYLLIGVIGMLLAGVLWASIELSSPTAIQGAFLIAVLLVYAARRTVSETIEDERTNVITQHAAVATLSVFWIIFFLVSIGSVVWEFSRPLGILPPRPPGAVVIEGPHSGNLGLVQLALLGLTIILYGGSRIYYARKFGDWESDEE